MPIRAYCLISTDPGQTMDVADKVSKIQGSPLVKKTSVIIGRYDVIAEIEDKEAQTLESLSSTILSKIAKIPGVRRTETVVVTWEK
jgi:DNA-binding Lrp family transcriptional regulator